MIYFHIILLFCFNPTLNGGDSAVLCTAEVKTGFGQTMLLTVALIRSKVMIIYSDNSMKKDHR